MGDKTGQVAGDMGDRAFGETDEALTVYEIKERDPDFAMMGFMKEVKEVIIPEVPLRCRTVCTSPTRRIVF